MQNTIICMVDNRKIYDLNTDVQLFKIFNINYNYALKNNYKFMFFEIGKCLSKDNKERHPAWGKVAVLHYISKEHPNTKILYIDSDAIFASFQENVDSIFLNDNNIFTFWEDAQRKNHPMIPISGVIGINNNDLNLKYIDNILSEWYDLKETRLWEQGVLQDILFPKYKNYIYIIPSLGFDFHKESKCENGKKNENSIWKHCRFKPTDEGISYYHHNIKDKHFIYHFFGGLKKENSMDLILTDIYKEYNISNTNIIPKSSEVISILNDKVSGILYTYL